MIVVKLGGSVITDKSSRETVDEERLRALATALGDAAEREVIVVHGGGSFGHPAAAERGMGVTDATGDVDDAIAVHAAMGRLNARVVDALEAVGVAALPVRPLSFVHRTPVGELNVPSEGLRTMVGEGFTPVLHGDVVVHAGEGLTIASGDALVAALARVLPVDRVGLCSAEPGVLDEDGAVVQRIDDFEQVAAVVGESQATDVTGGMAGKVRTLLDIAAPAHVFGPDDLRAFLAGGTPGTTIRGPGST